MRRTVEIRYTWLLALIILALVSAGLSLPPLQGSVAAEAASTAAGQATAVPQQVARAAASTVLDESAAANAMEAQIEAVYEATSPSVVNITNRTTVYNRFMGAQEQEGTGSGFVYDAEGHIFTNYHVIEGADEILVTLSGGQVFSAELVGSDPTNDLAVLKVDAGDVLPLPLALGDSGDLRVGQAVLAIGNPFGLQQTLTTGVVSALGRVIESPEEGQYIGEAIQTDAAINPGNSGGPMLDLQGRVIGINSQILSTSGSSAGIGFAVSSNTILRVVPRLIEQGYYPHAWLGADMVELTSANMRVLEQAGADIAADSGLLVLSTAAGGPADEAGVQAATRYVRIGHYQVPTGGDVIAAVDGIPLADLATLTVYLETAKTVGDTVVLTVNRDGEILTLPVVLGEQPR
ncbi:MAG TPA: trypsin-like peptidase domain-containing protein [Anaerolineae bacterium]|nr:trypsin-like peptidase domain-containing protein [Anaerolineae bacterium]